MSWQTRLGVGAGAVVVLYYGWPLLGLRAHLLLVAFIGGPALALAWHWLNRTGSRVVRVGKRTRRKHGVASTTDVLRFASAWAVRRKARIVRPSLRRLTRRARMRLATSQVGIRLCRVGLFSVWMSVEDNTAVIGGPRKGKSGLLGGYIVDSPGAAISTSTRLDLLELTHLRRAEGGRPVYVYNPAALGEDAGPDAVVPFLAALSFDPLSGCKDPQRASETAIDMIPTSGGDAERWDAQARRVLATLLHAAALAELSCTVLPDWVSDPGNDGVQAEIMNALRRSSDLSHLEIARQFLETNDRTRSSVTSSIMPALAWMTVPSAVASLRGGVQLDVAQLIAERATVYLLGRHEANTAALLGALTGRIVRDGRRLAARSPKGRLDPPLRLVLDEAARIAPIDLPDVSGDSGGSGITLICAFQSLADIKERWGDTGRSRLLTNCAARMLFGGCGDAAEAKMWADLAGERDEIVWSHDKDGRKTGHTTRKVPVLAIATIITPGPRRVIVFHHAMPPVIGRVRMAWRRHDVRESILWRILIGPVSRWRENAAPQVGGWAPVIPPASPAVLPASPVPLPRPPSDVPAVETAGGEA